MHIEPGLVDGTKLILSYATAAGAAGLALKMAADTISKDGGLAALAMRSLITTALVFTFFQIFPHHPVGVSEVHLILGASLFLMFVAGPAAIGLALGLLAQGALFEPVDLPQYGMNVTTLIVPLWGVAMLAKRIIPAKTAYVDLRYHDVLALSAAYQGGVIAWVGFWVVYGQGADAQTLAAIGTFGLAYASVILLEPLISLALLAGAKALAREGDKAVAKGQRLVLNARLHEATVR